MQRLKRGVDKTHLIDYEYGEWFGGLCLTELPTKIARKPICGNVLTITAAWDSNCSTGHIDN